MSAVAHSNDALTWEQSPPTKHCPAAKKGYYFARVGQQNIAHKNGAEQNARHTRRLIVSSCWVVLRNGGLCKRCKMNAQAKLYGSIRLTALQLSYQNERAFCVAHDNEIATKRATPKQQKGSAFELVVSFKRKCTYCWDATTSVEKGSVPQNNCNIQ